MATKITKKILPVSLVITGFLLILQSAVVFASNATTFSQTISDGSRSVDIVDADGVTVGSPGVTFAGKTFSFAYQTSAGTLGASAQRIRIYNPTGGVQSAFTVSMAATGGATTVWTDGGSNTYDFNDTGTDGTDDADADSKGGRLTVDPSGASIAAVTPCASTTGVSMGSANSFKEVAIAVTSITLVSGTSDVSTYCRWDIGASTGISLSQVIPGGQPSAAYTIGFTITIA